MKVKVSELNGAALDWAVAKAEGVEVEGVEVEGVEVEGRGILRTNTSTDGGNDWVPYAPSRVWSQGGQIIEHNGILLDGVSTDGCAYKSWSASMLDMVNESGPTPLISAMRCLVASKFGVEVDIPEELCKL